MMSLKISSCFLIREDVEKIIHEKSDAKLKMSVFAVNLCVNDSNN